MQSMTGHTKVPFLSPAEVVVSEKKRAKSSIPKIARKAGVGDSVILQYFKGKQGLLFSVPGEQMVECSTRSSSGSAASHSP